MDNHHSKRLMRLVGLVLLTSGLLLGIEAPKAVDSASAQQYGPCRSEDSAFSKCVHYKLQEARRLGPTRDGACSQFRSAVDNVGHFYWRCRIDTIFIDREDYFALLGID